MHISNKITINLQNLKKTNTKKLEIKDSMSLTFSSTCISLFICTLLLVESLFKMQ
jgi:hypothetical protein